MSKQNFWDGVKDVFSSLINRRNGINRSQVVHYALTDDEMRTLYKSGLMSKVFRLKAGYALNDTLQFSSSADKELYESKLANDVKVATKFMMGFGRGCIVLFKDGDDLTEPLGSPDPKELKIRTFSGDMTTVNSTVYDLRSPRYYKPKYYFIRGNEIHWTRVVDFTYYQPVEWEAPDYKYGGISESELVYEQYINDSIVQRATGSIVDKASTFIYKIAGYKDMIQSKREQAIVDYVSTCEDGRSIYGGLITDKEDEVDVISQSIADLDKVDQITLRRIAMVTGIGMTDLIGEQPGGLNANGADERSSTVVTVTNMQSDYLLEPINQLAKVFGMGPVSFKENQGESARVRVEYESKVIANSKSLWEMGEDYEGYLKDKGITVENDWDNFWSKGEGKSEADLLAEFLNEPSKNATTNQE